MPGAYKIWRKYTENIRRGFRNKFAAQTVSIFLAKFPVFVLCQQSNCEPTLENIGNHMRWKSKYIGSQQWAPELKREATDPLWGLVFCELCEMASGWKLSCHWICLDLILQFLQSKGQLAEEDSNMILTLNRPWPYLPCIAFFLLIISLNILFQIFMVYFIGFYVVHYF